jgi:hypothetical protein
MSDANRFTIVCPCCEATLTVDADTGTLLSHEEKHKASARLKTWSRIWISRNRRANKSLLKR